MEYTELPHRHGNDRDLSRLEHCMQEAESFQAVAGLCRLLSDANRVRIFWLLCHCEECVVNLAALVGMSSPAASHHLRQLKDSGLVVSRRIGKEVYYRAADTEVAGLLHQVIERTVEVTCPREEAMPHAPHLPPVDAHAGEHAADLTPQQREIIHQVHQLLTENLDSRITIEQLSRRFLMNPSTMKERQLHRRPHPAAPDGKGVGPAAGVRRQPGPGGPGSGVREPEQVLRRVQKGVRYAALGVPEAPRRTLSRPACFRRECTCYLR